MLLRHLEVASQLQSSFYTKESVAGFGYKNLSTYPKVCAFLGACYSRLIYFYASAGAVTAGYRMYGDELELKKNAVQHLYEVYVKFNKLLDKDPNAAKEAESAATDLEQGCCWFQV